MKASVDEDIDSGELFASMANILKGMLREVPARMAIEHATNIFCQWPNVLWTAFALVISDEVQCIAASGRQRPLFLTVEDLISPWVEDEPELERSLTSTKVSGPGRSKRLLYAVEVLASSGDRIAWFACLCEQPASDKFCELLRTVAWMISSALEYERVHSQMMSLDQRHVSVVESLPHVIYEQSLDGRLHYISRKIFKLTGHRPVDLFKSESSFEDMIHPEDRARRRSILEELRPQPDQPLSYDYFLESQSPRNSLEYRLIHKNGRDIVWVADHYLLRIKNPNETLASPISSQDFVVIGSLIDLRTRKRLEIESLQQSRLATIGELAAGVAHEINNPLTAVLTYSQLLERWLSRQDIPEKEQAKGLEYLGHILEQGKAIHDITRNLTGFVRKDTVVTFEPISATELIKTSLSIFRYPFKKEHIRLSIDIPVELPPIRARARHIRQVLLNLVGNARIALNSRYPLEGGAVDSKVLESKAIEIKAGRHPDDERLIRISVRDFGDGIPAENLEKIFDAFFSTRKEGTGLGLSISANITKEHGGLLSAESTVNEGTCFYLDLPIWTSKPKTGRLTDSLLRDN